jgi:hypothetical protein
MIKKLAPLQLLRFPRRKSIRALLLYLLPMLLILSLPFYLLTVTGLPVSGKIVYSDGSLSVKRHSEERKMGSSAKLCEGDLISTEGIGRTVIAFSNLVSLRLSHETELELTKVRLYATSIRDYLKGRNSSLCAVGGELTLVRGSVWVDKTAGALFSIRAGDAVIYPGRAACEIFRNRQGSVCISVYRGDVKVGLVDQPVFKAKIFPGQECVVRDKKFEKLALLRYRPNDAWQNWNMALSYVAPPSEKVRHVAYQHNGWKPGISPPQHDEGPRRAQDVQKQDAVPNDRTNPYSFKKWVEEKTGGGRDAYPKYNPSGQKVTQIPFSEFPEAPPSTGRGDRGSSDGSAPPAPPAMGPEGITAIFSSRYSGTSFTPVWGSADDGASSSHSESKTQKGTAAKNEWLPFVKEDNLPPPPPSLNNLEEQ